MSEIRATGALPRAMSRYGGMVELQRFGDTVGTLPPDRVSEFYDDYSLVELVESLDLPFDQNGYGSCVSEAFTANLMILRKIAGMPDLKLSPLSCYWFTSGQVDRGSTLDETLRYFATRGVLPMDDWPRTRGFRSRPTPEEERKALKFRSLEGFDLQSKLEMQSCLACGWPAPYARKGHCILALSYNERGVLYLNSWGNWTNCGKPGFGFDPWSNFLSSLRQWGAFALRVPTDDGTTTPPELELEE